MSPISLITLDKSRFLMNTAASNHEKEAAIHTIIEKTSEFSLKNSKNPPFILHIGLKDNKLIIEVKGKKEELYETLPVPLSPLRRIIKDYSMICDAYMEAVEHANPARIEAIDMGRRGVHNEGAECLEELLEDKVSMDFETARNFFTLIYVLYRT